MMRKTTIKVMMLAALLTGGVVNAVADAYTMVGHEGRYYKSTDTGYEYAYIKTSWYCLYDVENGVTYLDSNFPNGFTGDNDTKKRYSVSTTAGVMMLGLTFRTKTYYFPGYGMHANGASVAVTFGDFISGQILELTWLEGNGSSTIDNPVSSGANYSETKDIYMVNRSTNMVARMLNFEDDDYILSHRKNNIWDDEE